MSIFDTLRYPIPHDITYDQLEELPTDLRRRWTLHPDFYYDSSIFFDPIRSKSSMTAHYLTPENLALLRRIIAEWDA